MVFKNNRIKFFFAGFRVLGLQQMWFEAVLVFLVKRRKKSQSYCMLYNEFSHYFIPAPAGSKKVLTARLRDSFISDFLK